jgi:hypothetical protein
VYNTEIFKLSEKINSNYYFLENLSDLNCFKPGLTLFHVLDYVGFKNTSWNATC